MADRIRNLNLEWCLPLILLVSAILASAQVPMPGQRQGPPSGGTTSSSSAGMTGERGLTVLVRDQWGPLRTFAIVEISSVVGSVRMTQSTRQDSRAVFPNLPAGTYRVEVTAPGYEKASEQTRFDPYEGSSPLMLYLKPEAPTGAPLPPGGPPILAPKAHAELQRGIEALRSNKLEEAEKHLARALKLAPSHPDVLYAVGILAMKRGNANDAKRYLEQAVLLDPTHAAARSALGGLLLQQGDLTAALSHLEKALAANPDSWRTQWLLAETYFRQRNYASAAHYAERAVKLGKEQSDEARLLLARALVALGQPERAAQELDTFLRNHPQHPGAEAARQLRQRLVAPQPQVQPTSAADAVTDEAATPPPAVAASPSLASNRRPWDPEATLPAVAPNIPCPLPEVLRAANQRMRDFIASMEKIGATEVIEQAAVGKGGSLDPVRVHSAKYFASVSETQPGVLNVDEYRDVHFGAEGTPIRVATTGLIGMALVLHPALSPSYEISCLGLAEWRGRAAWLLVFQQRPDRPAPLRSYRTPSRVYYLKLKGRAWVDAETHEVLRVETSLMEAIPALRLRRDDIAVEYRAVEFPQRKTRVLVPLAAEVYGEFRGRRYYERHTLSDFHLFSVDVEQQIRPPQQP